MSSRISPMFDRVADTSSAGRILSENLAPIVMAMGALATLACVFFLINGGIQYMTSAGRPEKLDQAKRIIRNALIGLVLVLGAGVLTAILSHAYSGAGGPQVHNLPPLDAIKPQKTSGGLVDVLINAITGMLQNIIQSAASPFLGALDAFTKATPLVADNNSVFNLWLVILGMTDALFVIVIALIGFHVMSASTFGMDEIEFKHVLPQVALIFLLANTSVFLIDTIIKISNAMISALRSGFPTSSVWEVLKKVVENSSDYGLAALLIMVVFLVLSIILLVYYVGRIVTLYIGAVMSPLVLVLYLLPGFKDFAITAIKSYLTTIFVLFVHVVIIALAASLFASVAMVGDDAKPDPLMSLVVGLATIIALLKTQGVLMQLAYVSTGPRTARQLGSQFANGVSHLSNSSRTVAGGAKNVYQRGSSARRNPVNTKARITSQPAGANIVRHTTKPNSKQTTRTSMPPVNVKDIPLTKPKPRKEKTE